MNEELQQLEAAHSVSDRDTLHFGPLARKETFRASLIIIAFFTYPFWLFNLFATVSDTFTYFEYRDLVWVSTSGEIFQVASDVHRGGPGSYSCNFTFHRSKKLFQSPGSCTEIVEKLSRSTEFSEMDSIRSKSQGASIQLTKRVPITVFYEKNFRRIEITRDELGLPNPSKPDFPGAAWILFFAVLTGVGLVYHVLTRDRPQPPEPAESFR